jgi:uncharacterized membrane protein YoaK (UPF0700 family)
MGGDRKLLLAQLLSLLGGYVDTAGFLALQGLFTAHVTGNFVTLGASLALGTSGAVAKLLALPAFCLVVVVTRLFSFRLPKFGLQILRTMLTLKALLLAIGAGLAIGLGPFPNGDAWQAVLTGMVLVAARSIQNATHRIHLPSTPPTTLMTGTTTQIMIDVADLLGFHTDGARAAPIGRIRRMTGSLVAFAAGCAAAAAAFRVAGMWCFVAPPVLSFVSVAMSRRADDI